MSGRTHIDSRALILFVPAAMRRSARKLASDGKKVDAIGHLDSALSDAMLFIMVDAAQTNPHPVGIGQKSQN